MGRGGETPKDFSRLGSRAARSLITFNEEKGKVKSCNWGGGTAPGMSTRGHPPGSTSAVKELHKAGVGEAEPTCEIPVLCSVYILHNAAPGLIVQGWHGVRGRKKNIT